MRPGAGRDSDEMDFRTRLLLSITLLVTLTCITAGVFLYRQARESTFGELQSKVLSIAASAAAGVDGDLHRRLQQPEDEETPEYLKLVAELREVRDLNRRADVYVSYIYTMVWDDDAPESVRFVLDAEEDPAQRSRIGDPYEGKSGQAFSFAEPQVDTEFSVDRWGTWLSANAPIRDSSGVAVAILGVDVRAQDVIEDLARIRTGVVSAVSIAFFLAIMMSVFLSNRVSRPLVKIRATVEKIGQGNFEARVNIKSKDEFGQVADAINAMAVGLREREELKGAFARYVSQEVMEQILRSRGELSLKGDRRKVTILFSDIRNFTTLAEGHTPEEVVGFLNDYFEHMIEIIFRNHGTLDKFLGDGLMVLFGAPLEDSLQEYHAVCAAVEMQQELERLRAKWAVDLHAQIRIGIGIHTGQAIVGNIGSTRRMEYTAIGDAVNVASRLETATKTVGVSILVSETTHSAVADRFRFEDQGPITVKGRQMPIQAYSPGLEMREGTDYP